MPQTAANPGTIGTKPLAVGTRGRRAAVSLFLAALVCAATAAQNGNQASPPPEGSIDLVLILDDSASVLRWSAEVDQYLLGPFVRDYLRLGDTVHLLAFGSRAQVDTVRTVAAEGDVKAILGQIFLLYPVDRHTDFIGALDFLTGYLKSLDPARKKLVVIVTDGVQDPPPGSTWASLDAAAVSREVDRAAASLKSLGWPLRFVMLPFGSDQTATLPSVGSSTSSGSPATKAGVEASVAGAVPAGAPATGTAATPRSGISTGPATAPSGSSAAETATPPRTSAVGSDQATGKLQQGLPPEADTAIGAAAVPGAGVAAADEAAKALQADVTQWPPQGEGGGAAVGQHAAVPAGTEAAPTNGTAAGGQLGGAAIGQSSSISPVPSAEAAASLGLPGLEFPQDLGRQGRDFTLPLVVTNPGTTALSLELLSVKSGDQVLFSGRLKATIPPESKADLAPRLRLPDSIPIGNLELPLDVTFADGLRTMPGSGTVRLELVEGSFLGSISTFALPAFIGIAIFFALALLVARILGWIPSRLRSGAGVAMRRSAETDTARIAGAGQKNGAEDGPSRPSPSGKTAAPRESSRPGATPDSGRTRANPASVGASALTGEVEVVRKSSDPHFDAADTPPASMGERGVGFAHYVPVVKRGGSIEIELRVVGQNSHIGKRNIHVLHAGHSKSVGGRRSDFLIFFVPVPQAVAELHFDGEACVFVPKQARFFPDLEGPIEDCLDRDIPMIAPTGYAVTLRFMRWEEPSLRINRLLHCIDVPGLAWESDFDSRGKPSGNR